MKERTTALPDVWKDFPYYAMGWSRPATRWRQIIQTRPQSVAGVNSTPLPRQPLPSPHRVGQLLRDGRGERRIIAVRFKPAYAKAEHEGRQRDRAEEGVEGGGVTSAPYPGNT